MDKNGCLVIEIMEIVEEAIHNHERDILLHH